jgi:hypothetical protein
LDFKQNGTVLSTKKNSTRCAAFQKTVDIRDWWLHAFCGFVAQVLDNNLALLAIQNSEAISA